MIVANTTNDERRMIQACVIVARRLPLITPVPEARMAFTIATGSDMRS